MSRATSGTIDTTPPAAGQGPEPENEPTIGDVAGEEFDLASAAGASEQPEPTPAAPAAPEPAKPAAPAGQPPAAAPTPTSEQLTARAAQLDQTQQQLVAYHEQLRQITSDPAFQAGYQAYQQRSGQPGQGSSPGQPQQGPQQAPPGGPQAGAPDVPAILAKFQPDTENETLLLSVLRWQHEHSTGLEKKFEERFGRIEPQVGQMSAQFQAQQAESSNREIDAIEAELKKHFPDLLDGGKQQEALEQAAAELMDAALARGRVLPMREAFTKAARLIGYDAAEERARSKLQRSAAAAAQTRLETPEAGASGEGGGSVADIAGQEYDRAMRG